MHNTSHYDPAVFRHKTTLMQRTLDYVRLGYHWHISGSVPLARAPAFVRKSGISIWSISARISATGARSRDSATPCC